MKTLELFAGTQSFSKGIQRQSSQNQSVTVDILTKFKPTHTADILEWEYKQYDPKYFDVIWCSPPCTEYSRAKTIGTRKLELADKLVLKCFEIIDYLQPKIWIIENVGTGLLVKRMEQLRPNLNKYMVDYCYYGKPYRKRTVLWSNIELSLNLCQGKGKCPSMIDNHHLTNFGNSHPRYSPQRFTVWQRNSIPEKLIDEIICQILM